jgi:hypothetical protein
LTGHKQPSAQPYHPLQIEDFLGRFTLIVGDVNRGKTTLTRRILDACCKEHGGPISVVDLAPTFPPSKIAGVKGKEQVGGRLDVSSSPMVRYFHGLIHAPRLTAKSEAEAEALAKSNVRTIEDLFMEALKEEAEAIFVNDCSLYLHAGNPKKLLQWIRSARTAVVNGYEGRSLGEGLLTVKEREGMAFLTKQCDRLIRL